MDVGLEGASQGAREARERARGLVRLALPFYGFLAALAMAWRWFVRDTWIFVSPVAAEGAPAWAFRSSLALGLVIGLALVAASHVWTRFWPSGEEVSRSLGEAIGDLRPMECILLALASGFAEEMVFRGALQPEVGVLWASILFGLAHLVPRWPLILWTAFAVAVGAVFGLVFEWTGSLWAPVVAHVVVNAVNLPVLSRRYGRG